MADIPTYRGPLYRAEHTSVRPALDWQPLTVWRYTLPDGRSEITLRELPLTAYPAGTTRDVLEHAYELAPGAHIGFSGTWQAQVVFPAPPCPAVAREIGVPFADALADGSIRTRR